MCDPEQDTLPGDLHLWVPGQGKYCGSCGKGPMDHPAPVDHYVGEDDD